MVGDDPTLQDARGAYYDVLDETTWLANATNRALDGRRFLVLLGRRSIQSVVRRATVRYLRGLPRNMRIGDVLPALERGEYAHD